MTESAGRARQSEIYLDGVLGRIPRVPVSYPRLVKAAKRAMSKEAFAYVAGSAGLETTASANRRAFGRHRIVPRVLKDVGTRDPTVELFGTRRSTPLYLAPIGVLDLAHADADTGAARAGAGLGIPVALSTQASTPMERVTSAIRGAEAWYQLYWSSSRELTESLVRRAEASGCEALLVTLDTHLLGWRPRDLDLGFLPFARGRGIAQYTSDPVFMRLVNGRIAATQARPRPKVTPQAVRTLVEMSSRTPGSLAHNLRSPVPRAAVETFLDLFADPTLTWPDLTWLRSITNLPIVLKGVLHPDDARGALDSGVDGIIVSNHGGRQVDGAVAALDALPNIVDVVSGRIPVLFDSGVRSGADVFVALALGASAVGIGRPYVYGLAAGGEAGARDVLRNILAEFDITMALAGCTTIAEITRDTLAPG
ncbi:lactate 2-monooxygenase [Planctomonas sp. JC2975]|uniref:alpha-hydroxy-acid oxidizing protein n=1 Tax=Planctomonas sp. JC2975 TaxID=2729626 RepID=UPI001474ADCA|nr:alpha-hydroxy-acid oxidizing protein [Planctomonas sp. JC2975]NNC13305.1 lactate 2-monooxygenase [Planctomonas sp. JC2975]